MPLQIHRRPLRKVKVQPKRSPTATTLLMTDNSQPDALATTTKPVEEEGGQMTFFEHLVELRKRIVHSLIAIAIGSVLDPGITTTVARHLGVGRGADLVLYLLVIAFGFTAAGLYFQELIKKS